MDAFHTFSSHSQASLTLTECLFADGCIVCLSEQATFNPSIALTQLDTRNGGNDSREVRTDVDANAVARASLLTSFHAVSHFALYVNRGFVHSEPQHGAVRPGFYDCTTLAHGSIHYSSAAHKLRLTFRPKATLRPSTHFPVKAPLRMRRRER